MAIDARQVFLPTAKTIEQVRIGCDLDDPAGARSAEKPPDANVQELSADAL
jgi:hypothetical protein